MRKEKTIVLTDRDKQLTFKIREMPATRLESWIVRAGLLLASTGMLKGLSSGSPDAGEVINAAGRAMAEEGLSALGRIDYEKAAPLLDELLACCCRVDAGIEQQMTPDVADGIIEDVRTLFALRREALALNLGFFAPAGASGSADGAEQSPASSGRKISVRSRH